MLANLQINETNEEKNIEQFNEMLDGCKSCSGMLINLVNDLLDLAK
jgi:hypothetical protein